MGEWKSYRVIHSLGGIRLINEHGPQVRIFPNSVTGKVATFETQTYEGLFSRSEQIGLPILGVEFYRHPDQFDGKDIPEWRAFYRSNRTVWENEQGAQLWGNIGNGGHRAKNGKMWDVGSRISQQLRVCGWRLKELSTSYNLQLISVSQDSAFRENRKFMNGYTWLCYMSIQSFLVDICILRDYLAEYTASFVLDREESKGNMNISTFSALKKHILINNDDPLANELDKISSDAGWLKRLGDYRDLVVHSAPLAEAEKRLLAITKTAKIPAGDIPYICCPIPKNPQKISASRANGSMFKDFEELIEKYVGVGEEDEGYIDGLTYCHEALGLMSCLANKLAARTPVKPQMLTIDSSSIIGEIKMI